jgi:hypothetical protein
MVGGVCLLTASAYNDNLLSHVGGGECGEEGGGQSLVGANAGWKVRRSGSLYGRLQRFAAVVPSASAHAEWIYRGSGEMR